MPSIPGTIPGTWIPNRGDKQVPESYNDLCGFAPVENWLSRRDPKQMICSLPLQVRSLQENIGSICMDRVFYHLVANSKIPDAVLSTVHGMASAQVITHNAAISACEKGGRWLLALSLFGRVQEMRLEPTKVACKTSQ